MPPSQPLQVTATPSCSHLCPPSHQLLMRISQTFFGWQVGLLQTLPGLYTLSVSARSWVSVCPRTSHLRGWGRTRLRSSGADDIPREARAGCLSRLAGNHLHGLRVARLWQLPGRCVIGFSCRDCLTHYPDVAPMPVLGPSLLFCGKPACWIRGSNTQDKVSRPAPSPVCRTGLPWVQSHGDWQSQRACRLLLAF